MDFLVIEDNIITNIVVAEPDIAEELGFLPWYDGARIGAAIHLAEPLSGVRGMKGRIDLHIGRNEGIVTNDNQIIIQKSTVHIHFAVIAEIDVISDRKSVV